MGPQGKDEAQDADHQETAGGDAEGADFDGVRHGRPKE